MAAFRVVACLGLGYLSGCANDTATSGELVVNAVWLSVAVALCGALVVLFGLVAYFAVEDKPKHPVPSMKREASTAAPPWERVQPAEVSPADAPTGRGDEPSPTE